MASIEQRDVDNQNDHKDIMVEIRGMREDFNKVINVTREEQQMYRTEFRDEMKAFRDLFEKITTKLHSVDKNADAAKLLSESNKNWIRTVGGAVTIAIIGGVGKGLGWW